MNAFSELQQEQLDVLQQITDTLLPSKGPDDVVPNDPHPRRAAFEALSRGIEVKHDVVQKLTDMLDGLQSEVRGPCSITSYHHSLCVLCFQCCVLTISIGTSTNLWRARLARQRHRSLHHHHRNLSPAVIRGKRVRDEHVRRAGHGADAEGLLGIGG